LDISGAMTANGMSSAPSVSASNTGRIYYDYSANKFKVSQNGAAYVDLVSSGGITSLGGQTGGTQTLAISVDNSVATPTITSATNAHTWKIPMASNTGTTAGLLNKTDYDSFVAKLGTSTVFAGDVSGTYNATSVDKIKGKAVTAASVSGQMMIYNGTAWNNAVMSGDATMDYAGALTLAKVPVSKGGTNSTTFGNNRIIASNGTGTALVDFTCSLNQVISFDASGNSVCANMSASSGGITNGGNTTGADISIGTNDNKALAFKVNNSTVAMTISQSGNIGVATNAPTVALDVSGAIRPGSSASVTTCGSGAANGEGSQRYNYTTHFMEYCNGTGWISYAQAQTTSSGIVAPAGSGYFVLTATTYAGNASANLTGWDTACLNELKTNNTSWRGYATANANGQLTATKVHAFLCYDTGGCNNLTPLATYYFANAGDASAGGASFTTDASGLGPNDSVIWSAANYFNLATNYFTGRASGTATVWSSASSWGMNNGSNGAYGNSGNTDANRWRVGNSLNSSLRIICYVNP
jgi:hypothetical protein